MSFLGASVPQFWISGDVSSGFCLIHFCGSKCIVHSLRSTSGATPANLLTGNMAAIVSLHVCFSRGRNWLGIKRATTCTED